MTLPALPTVTAGKKIVGLNIGLKGGVNFPALFAEWDWTGWFKRQVDLAASVAGVNCIRMIGAPAGCHSSLGPLYSTATYVARWVQFTNYVAAAGLYLYPCLGSDARGDAIAIDKAELKPFMLAVASALDGYPNVIGFDAYNEGGWDYNQTGSLFTDLRTVTSKPLTLSQVCWGPEDFTSDLKWLACADFGDFHDMHLYTAPPRPWAARDRLDRLTKPVLFGEYGSLAGGDFNTRYDFLYAVRSMHEIDGIAGSLRWAVIDEDAQAGNAWGVFDINDVARPTDRQMLESFRRQRLLIP